MFVEKLTKKDFSEFLKNNAFTSYSIAKEIEQNFIEKNNLKLNYPYEKIPEIFKNIKSDFNRHIFSGFKFNYITKNNESLIVNYEIYQFTYASWVGAYILDNLPLVMNVSDFTFQCLPFTYDIDINKDIIWYQFMYSKFGEEYLTALKGHLESKKNNKIKKISEECDKENKEIIEEVIK